MNVTAWRRELDRLSARVAPPPVALSGPELARKAGIEPDPWQAQVLESRADRILINASRQSGKSTITAVVAVHTALNTPGALVLLLSPTLRQSGELFRKCLSVYRTVGRPVPAEAETALTLELATGSRIVSLPGKEATIRGYSGAALVVVDEAARVADPLLFAVRPMLATSAGRLIALSTPWGRRGWFWGAWDQGGSDWELYEVPATAVPRIPADFLAQERRSMPAAVFNEEYLCQFGEAEDAVFRHEDLDAMFTSTARPLFPEEIAHVA